MTVERMRTEEANVVTEERENVEVSRTRETNRTNEVRREVRPRLQNDTEVRETQTEVRETQTEESSQTEEVSREENATQVRAPHMLRENNQTITNRSEDRSREGEIQDGARSIEAQTLTEEIEERNEELEEETTFAYEEEREDWYEEEEEDEDEQVKERWVKNISSRVLTTEEVNLLRKGGGFAVTPRELPHLDYITAIEKGCRNLAKGEAMCMRAEAIAELEKAKIPKSNLNPEEWKALKSLKDDEKVMVLPADKGKCLVVMDREEYLNKMEEKLKDETTYKRIKKDPTNEIKKALANQLEKIKEEQQIDQRTYYRLYPLID